MSRSMQIDIYNRAYIELPETSDWEETLSQLGAVETAIFSGAPDKLLGLMALKRFVLMRVIQLDWNSKYKPVPIPRGKGHKELIDAHARFWLSAIAVIKQLDFASDVLPVSKFQAFKVLFLEDGLTLDSVIAPESETATSLHKLMQAQNRKLMNHENPFEQECFPMTWEFINHSIQLADRNDQFSKHYFRRMAKKRGELTALKNSRNTTLYSAINGRFVPSRQGGKKNSEQ